MPKITLCATCEIAAASLERFEGEIRHALDETGLEGFTIARVDCMGACENPLALALQGEGRATYLFAGIDPASDAKDVAATGRIWLESPDGWIENALGCGRLRHCLRARIPPL